ncbi:hypothetical protein Lalb_Chr11g0074901 [Lupinus albus]|uniref:Uncharacterized protein n=1 Tax=Lupinus albus TaxID=3870 RepID=A0A6A4PTY5_LUPAL|nr:hypothetical protein Lalb_Chr11g0074901 [Lupinus albus]
MQMYAYGSPVGHACSIIHNQNCLLLWLSIFILGDHLIYLFIYLLLVKFILL